MLYLKARHRIPAHVHRVTAQARRLLRYSRFPGAAPWNRLPRWSSVRPTSARATPRCERQEPPGPLRGLLQYQRLTGFDHRPLTSGLTGAPNRHEKHSKGSSGRRCTLDSYLYWTEEL